MDASWRLEMKALGTSIPRVRRVHRTRWDSRYILELGRGQTWRLEGDIRPEISKIKVESTK
jgi:hypothetical protein